MLWNERSDGDGATVDRPQDCLTPENGHEKDVLAIQTMDNGPQWPERQSDNVPAESPCLPTHDILRNISTLLRLSKGLKLVDVLFLIDRIISEDQRLTNRAEGVFNPIEICTSLLISPGSADH